MKYPNADSKSSRLFSRSSKVQPDSGSRTTIRINPYAVYAAEASGKYITDVDGNRLFDFNNNYTSMLHGHAHPRIVAAATEQIKKGTGYCFGSEPELELSELLCGRVDGFDKIRFTNSGTEAVMNAIKAARAYTGKPKIAKCENAYHGSYDYAEVSLGVEPTILSDGDPESQPYSYGTPQGVMDDVVVIPVNEPEISRRILDEHADSLAGVLIDPIGMNLARIPLTDEYLGMIRSFCDDNPALFIADEVVSFRAGYQGLQGERKFRPDLTTLGKIIGGGFPVGALAGNTEYMSVFESDDGKAKLPHGGTYNGNPVSMAAGLVAMEMMTKDEFARINVLGKEFRDNIREVLRQTDAEGQVQGQYSIFAVTFDDPSLSDANLRGYVYHSNGLHRYLVQNGYWMTPGMVGVLSTAMDSSDVAPFCETLMNGITELRKSSAA
jgi:glutamate-1-semialdehyde 2,1-aminomutase